MIVDVHGHVTHPELLERFPMPRVLGDIDGMLEQKEAAGIDMTIVGSPVGYGTMVPFPGLDNYAQPPDQLASFHDWLGQTVERYSDHLRAYVYTNPFDETLLEQTAQTVREDAFVGLIVNTSVRGEYLDSERADAFFAMVEELGVPVLLHPPAEPVGAGSLRDPRLVEQVARPSDVTAGLAALIFSGRLERHPDVKLIGAMAGGAISLLAVRLELAYRMPAGGPPGGAPGAGGGGLSESPGASLARVYLDTTTYSRASLLANLETVGAGHILFGTDTPPAARPLDQAIGLVTGLPIEPDEARQILGQTAIELFALGATSEVAS